MLSQSLTSLVKRLTPFGVRLFRGVASNARTSVPNRPTIGNFAAKSLQIFELSGFGHAKADSTAAFDVALRFRHLSK